MDRSEIKEEIFEFLEKNRNMDVQSSQKMQLNSIISMAKNDKELELKYLDVFNEIILNGIVAWKNHPFFFLTELGKQKLDDEDFDVHDPDIYLKNFEDIDEITYNYLKEAIHSFNKGLYLSSIMCLGVASESLIISFGKYILTISEDRGIQSTLDSQRFDIAGLIRKIDEYCKREGRIKNYHHYGVAIHSFSNLIRNKRNEYNHPITGKVDFSLSYSFLILFKENYKLVNELKKHLEEIFENE